jgi:hypothetical protein
VGVRQTSQGERNYAVTSGVGAVVRFVRETVAEIAVRTASYGEWSLDRATREILAVRHFFLPSLAARAA